MTDLHVAHTATRDRLVPGRTSEQLVRTNWQTVVSTLAGNLGNGLVALMADVTPETVSRWANGSSGNPRTANERRIREAYRVYHDLVVEDSPHTVRAWFMGSNSELHDESPAEAILHERFVEVLAAARSFRDA